MGKEKDYSLKILEDCDDVFCDIVNNTIFDGQEVLRPEDLERGSGTSQIKFEGLLHGQDRDVIKYWKHGAIVLAAVGMENQTAIDETMPLRISSYDGAEYKQQVNRRLNEIQQKLPLTPFYPVITIVLYFGQRHWTGPKSLLECFPNIPEKLKPLVQDYKIHVYELAFMTPEKIQLFQSDIRFVLDFLMQYHVHKGRYVPIEGTISHVEETLNVMSAIMGDSRFVDEKNLELLLQKENVTMKTMLDEIFEEREKEIREEAEKGRRESERRLQDTERRLQESEKAYQEIKRITAEKDREIKELKMRLGMV